MLLKEEEKGKRKANRDKQADFQNQTTPSYENTDQDEAIRNSQSLE